ELESWAAQLGSDIPFCVGGGTKLALGRGEELEPLPDLDQLYAVLAKYKSLSVSTPWAYKSYREKFGDSYARTAEAHETRRRTGPSVPLLKAMQAVDAQAIGTCIQNDLEKVVLAAHPQVRALKDAFLRQNPLGAMMSGSGPTVFALTTTQADAETMLQVVQKEMNDPDLDLWVTRFAATGVVIPQ
ncbi:MAG: 4-(cytidine 5'-diphospho)-2-C-methyl-D-erythritol kinase, partial [Cyanobacteria bacterium P01_F01_bin.42]